MSQQMTAQPSEKAKQLAEAAFDVWTTTQQEAEAQAALLDYIASLEAQVSAPRPMEGSEPSEADVDRFIRLWYNPEWDGPGDLIDEKASVQDRARARTVLRGMLAELRSSREKERDARADSERLDWLADNCTSVSDGYGPNGELAQPFTASTHGRVLITPLRLPTVPREVSDWFRAAIDAARSVSLGASEEKGR